MLVLSPFVMFFSSSSWFKIGVMIVGFFSIIDYYNDDYCYACGFTNLKVSLLTLAEFKIIFLTSYEG